MYGVFFRKRPVAAPPRAPPTRLYYAQEMKTRVDATAPYVTRYCRRVRRRVSSAIPLFNILKNTPLRATAAAALARGDARRIAFVGAEDGRHPSRRQRQEGAPRPTSTERSTPFDRRVWRRSPAVVLVARPENNARRAYESYGYGGQKKLSSV